MTSLNLTVHQGGCWKPIFCFQKVTLPLKFVVSPLPTDPGLFSACTLCLPEAALAQKLVAEWGKVWI